jgi:hypothetical protein
LDKKIPGRLLKPIYEEWKSEYGPTFPLYGNDTVRHDISGSVRPLLSSTEIPHTRVLAEQTGIPKKTIQKMVDGEDVEFTWDQTDTLLSAMGKVDTWFNELNDYY